MARSIQIRRDLAAVWTSVNPILLQGEMGYEIDTDKFKVGNGVDDWNTLPYIIDGAVSTPAISAGTQSSQLGTVYFQDGNNVSFGLNGSVVTASASFSQSVQTQGSLNVSLSGNNTLGVLTNISSGTVYLAGGNNITLSQNGNSVTFIGGAGGGTQTAISGISGGTTQMTSGTAVFSDSHGISFGVNGNTITASHNGITDSSPFRLTANDSQLQFTSANTHFLGTTYTTHTHSQYVNTSATSAYQLIANSSLSLGTGATASFRHTSADSQLRFTSADSQLQFTSANSNFLGTAATQSFRHTSADSQLRFTSADSQLQFTSGMSNYLGTTYTTHTHSQYVNTSHSSLFQQTSQMTDYLGTGYTTHTHTQSNQTVGLYAIGNTTQNSSSSFDARTISLNGIGGITVGYSNGSVQLSAPGTSSISATGAVSISTNGNTISIGAPVQTNQTLGLYAVSNTTLSTSGTNDARTLSFQGAGIVSVGVSNGSVVISASAAGAADGVNVIAAGTQTANTTGTVLFQSGNGVTFGMSNSSVVTASVNTSYLGSNATSNFRHTSADSQLQFTSNTSAITSVAVNTSSPRIQGIIVSDATYTSGSVGFRNLNGITWQSTTGQSIQITHGLQYSSQMTDYQSTGAYLTTAAQSTQTFLASIGGNSGTTNSSRIGNGGFVFAGGNGVTINQSNNSVSWSVETAYQSQGAYLTTAALSNHSHGNPTLALTNLTGTTASASNGFTLSLSGPAAGLTTAALSSQTLAFTLSGNLATTNSSQILNGGYALAGGNGVTLQQSNNTLSFSVATNYQSQGAYLTTARASTDAVGLNTALTANGVSWTVNSSGISLNVPAFLTTAALSTQTNAFSISGNTGTTNSSVLSAGGYVIAGGSNVTLSMSNNSLSFHAATNALTTAALSNHSHGNPTLALTNLTGTTASASNGFTLSLSAAAPGAAAENNNINLLGANTSGNTTASGSTIGWSGINLTLSGTNNSIVNISAPATSSLSATGQVSISKNGSTISIGVPNPGTKSGYSPYGDIPLTLDQVGQSSIIFDPEYLPNLQFDRVVALLYNTNATNSSGSHSVSVHFGIYSQNVSTLSLLASASGSVAATHSGTAGSYSRLSGLRMMTIGMTTTITDGQYWLAFMSRTASGGANGTYSNAVISNLSSSTNNFNGYFGSAVSASVQRTLGNGVLSVQSAGLPNSVAFSDIVGTGTAQFRFPIVHLASSTV